MAAKPFDPTLKTLVEASPADWPVLLGLPPAPTEVTDADIATVSGARDKVLHVRAAARYLVHLEFQSGHDAAGLPRLLHLRNTFLENHRLPCGHLKQSRGLFASSLRGPARLSGDGRGGAPRLPCLRPRTCGFPKSK
jgi:hypothetical protein